MLIPAYSYMVLRFVTDNRASPFPSPLPLYGADGVFWVDSGPVGVPLPLGMAHGRGLVDADQQLAVQGGVVGCPAECCGSV